MTPRLPPPDGSGGDATGWLQEFVHAHRGELVALRRHLHAFPELSYAEFETTDLVAERLAAAGLEPRVLPGGCGLVCDIVPPGAVADGPVVALRADLDALAMDDEKEVGYRSQRPGVAHACGHDVHTTVALGAGLALAELLADPEGAGLAPRPGRVRLLFEPAEEALPSGALAVIEAGGLDDVVAVYGLHCDPKLDAGLVGVRTGPLTSATNLVTVELHGPGGHTARPHLTVDLVRVAGRVANELPDRVREAASALGEVLLVFGALEAGHTANVIPAHAHLRGTLRTPDRKAWLESESIVSRCLDELLEGTGADWHLHHRHGIPPVVNDERQTERLAAAAERVVGPGQVVEAPHSFGGDSFAWYVEQVPGSYARLGTHDPRRGNDQHDLHSSTFDVDERAIDIGVQVLALAALDALADAGR